MPARSARGRRAGMKRKIVEDVPEEPAAKVYNNPFERDVDHILDFVKTAGDRGFAFEGRESNLRMMKLCAAPALCEVREERHSNQTVMVGLMDDGLQNIEFRMVEDLKNCQTRLAEADSVLANLEQIRDESQKVLEAKDETLRVTREAFHAKREITVGNKKITEECRKELKIREKALKSDQDILDAIVAAYDIEFNKLTVAPVPEPPAPAPVEGEATPAVEGELEQKVEDLEIVEEKPAARSSAGRGRRRSAPKEPTVDERIERILAQMRKYEANESLLNALPFALRNALTNPQGFDIEAMNACTKFFAEKRMWAEGQVFRSHAGVEEQKAKLMAAEKEQATAQTEQTAAKELSTQSHEEAKIASRDLRQKNQDIDDHKKKDVDTRKRVIDMDGWINEIKMAIQMFSMLRDRTNPPPAPEPVVEETPIEAPIEPMEEVAAPIMEESTAMEIEA